MGHQGENAGTNDKIVGVETVVEAEHREIALRRAARAGSKRKDNPVRRDFAKKPEFEASGYLESGHFDTIGLALSGGGIRSAAFCAGAMQGLALNKVFDKIDYLSTVSGGGYIGTHVSVNMTRTGGGFPLLGEEGEKKDTPDLAEVRNNANYLKFGHPIEMLYNIAIYVRGLAANVLLIVPVILLLAGFTLLCNPTYMSLSRPDIVGFNLLPKAMAQYDSFGVTMFLALIVALGFAGWALSTSRLSDAGLNGRGVSLGGWGILALAVVAFLELQPIIVLKMIGDVSSAAIPTVKAALPWQNFFAWMQTLAAPFLAIVAFTSKYLGDFFDGNEGDQRWHVVLRKYASQLIVFAAALVLPLLLWSAYLLLVYWGVDMKHAGECFLPNPANSCPTRESFLAYSTALEVLGNNRWGPDILVHQAQTIPVKGVGFFSMIGKYMLEAGLAGLVLGYFLSANGNSPHRLYRDRLAKAFCFFMNNGHSKPVAAEDLKLSHLMGWQYDQVGNLAKPVDRTQGANAPNAPYHLINTALNVQRSKEVNKRGRNADIFVFSPLYTGSVATGFAKTKDMEQPGVASDLDLATAMAVSGAAASSNMGSQSMRPLALTLAAFNVRLGYWFKNPRSLVEKNLKAQRMYFAAEALGALDEKCAHVYLTDGGHIENLGAYELLRRRCRLIIIVDAEADKAMNFPSLIDLQRYARIDLGARIALKWSVLRKQSLDAQSNKGEARNGPHCAVGTVEYENGGRGLLFYVKSSVTGDENDYVRDYNRRYSDFPHETTGDQFFSEEQFEVYRALGFHAVNGALSGEHDVETDAGLENLLDSAAKGSGLAEIRERLGLKAKPPKPVPASSSQE